MVCENKKSSCIGFIVRILALLTSGTAVGISIYLLIKQPSVTDVAFSDVIAVVKQSEGLDPRRKSLILNIATIVIGGIMWILVAISFILRWKHSTIIAAMSVVFIIIESLGFGATGILASLSVSEWINVISQIDDLFTNNTFISSGSAVAATAAFSLLASVTSGILGLLELILLVRMKLKKGNKK